MTIFNLPDEPDTPAGKAIQNAQTPTAEQLASKIMPNKFKMVFKSAPYLGESIKSALLDLGRKEIVFTATENGQYDWINWLLSVPEDETVTLFFLDEENKHRCILIVEDLYVFEHICNMQTDSTQFEFNSSENLEHKITVQFTNIERINQEDKKVFKKKVVKKHHKENIEHG